MKKFVSLMICLAIILSFAGCGKESETALTDFERLIAEYPGAKILSLDNTSAKLGGKALTEYNYVWNCDPAHSEPYYTGDNPAEGGAYIAHDIIYYPETDKSAFAKENYDGETEWVTHYTAENLKDYIFSTLPVLGDELPADMMHSADEAYKNPVIHITAAGEYIVSGTWNGQILVDLGDSDKTFTDKNAKVTLILAGADIKCSVAPAVIFKSVYESDNGWESRSEYGNDVDITDAGAKVILADGSENNIVGTNVFRILKPQYKKEGSKVQKKYVKTDGAFYSYVSLLIDGEKSKTGILNITSTTYEGLDSELHLTVNGGYINIVSADDGINVNEDNVSVFTMNGGRLTIFAGQGAEGDVIDSNGYITVNGGIIAGATPSVSDDILDCDCKKQVSEKATVISNTAGIKGGGMPMGEKPSGEPPAGDMQPPDGKIQPPDKPDFMPEKQ